MMKRHVCKCHHWYYVLIPIHIKVHIMFFIRLIMIKHSLSRKQSSIFTGDLIAVLYPIMIWHDISRDIIRY